MQRFIATQSRAFARPPTTRALYDWSIEQPAEFWAAVWRFCGIQASTDCTTPCCATRTRMPGAQLVRRRDAQLRGEPAATTSATGRRSCSRTSAASASSSAGRSCARRSRASPRGCARSASAAATASRASSRTVPRPSSRCSRPRASAPFGRRARRISASDAVLDRFGQIEPKVLFATDGYFYNGKSIDSLPLVRTDRGAPAGAAQPWS